MIDIKTLKENDVNRRVIYRNKVGVIKEGRITSWNDKIIFVDYYNNGMGSAANPEYLEFL